MSTKAQTGKGMVAADESKPRREPGFWSRFRRNVQAMGGTLVVLLLVISAVLAPVLAPYDQFEPDVRNRRALPSTEHFLGTDELGRDVLTRMLYGARISLAVAISAVGLAMFAGTVLGAVAGYFGGWVDVVISRIADTFLAIPGLILTIAMVAVLGPGLEKIVIAIAMNSWAGYARLVRGSFIAVKKSEFVSAARAMGARPLRIIVLHILPNAIAPVVVVAMLSTAGAILTEAGLSYLGIGINAPTPTWGGMLEQGLDYIRTAPHVAFFPGLAILITTLGFNLLGEGLRDILDPKVRKR